MKLKKIITSENKIIDHIKITGYKLVGHLIGLMSYLMFKLLCKGVIVNSKIIDRYRDTGFIIAANHISHLDWMVLFYYFYIKKIKLIFFAKEYLFTHPIYKGCMLFGESLMVSNESNKIYFSSYKKAMSLKYLAIFPEGTRSQDGNINIENSRIGIVKIAFKKQLPIIPTALIGFDKVLPKNGTFNPFFKKCKIVFHEPVSIFNSGKSDDLFIEEELQKIMRTIQEMVVQNNPS